MPIRVLSDDLAAKIAAGEVIERPASVVKELIENSIDAGATDIQVQIRGGGQRLIRVGDNGGGIPAAEVETAFARHATSKIESADDLFRIHTLGFRGEALPSIGSVARVSLITRARSEASGSELHVDGSQILDHHAQGAPVGTILTVEDLFRHVPARLKFLKAPGTEAGHIADLVNAYALAYPGLRLTLVNEERLVFQSPGTGSRFDALVKVFGVETARQMLPVGDPDTPPGAGLVETNAESNDAPLPTPSAVSNPPIATSIRVSGFVSPPGITRSNRKHMLFFLNHRWIQDRSLQHAVIEAYHTSLMVGRSPIVVLDILVPPDAVDVNVHPTKSEVRFREPGIVFGAVQHAVRAILAAHAPIPTITVGGPWAPEDFPPTADQSRLALDLHRPVLPGTGLAWNLSGPHAEPVPAAGPPSAARLPMLRVIGQIASTYIIAEGPDGLYLIDQHAAHERVLYEQLTAEQAGANPGIQELLDPAPIQLTLGQFALYQTNRPDLESVGFRIEPFGGETVLVRAVPVLAKKGDPGTTLVAILDEMERGEAPLEKTARARLITSICKSIAVKGGQVLSLEEMRELVRRLEQTLSPRTCPHGRPTVIQLNVAQLEREFGRK